MPPDKCVIDPDRDCIGAAKAAKLEARIEALEQWQVDSKRFHKDFYDWQRTQIARDAKLDEKLRTMDANLTKLVLWKEEEKSKPEKRWDAMTEKVLLLIVGALVTLVLSKVGLQ